LLVIVRATVDVAVAVLVETWAAATSDPGEMTASYVDVVLAENVGLVRARKAEKKFAKNGRLVGMAVCCWPLAVS